MSFTQEDYDRYIKDLEETSPVNRAEIKWPDEVIAFDELSTKETVELEVNGYKFKVYIRTAKNKVENSPLFINIHGGGWYIPHEDNDHYYASWLASQIKGVVVDVDYSTSDICDWNIMIKQCEKAADYAIEHCEELGCDKTRISIGGYSAGGHLTAGVVVEKIKKGEDPFALSVLAYAPFDMSKKEQPVPENEQAAKQQRRGNAFSGLLMRHDESLRDDPAFNLVKTTDEVLAKFPTSVVITADKCPFHVEDETFASRMISVGVETTVRRFPTTHGFIPHFFPCWDLGGDLMKRYICNTYKK